MAAIAPTTVKWEYRISVTGELPGYFDDIPDATALWTRKYQDGSTDWDTIAKIGNEGWEMVNAVPIARPDGRTTALVFVFKRPRPQPPGETKSQWPLRRLVKQPAPSAQAEDRT
jgi:hypothetical protein